MVFSWGSGAHKRRRRGCSWEQVKNVKISKKDKFDWESELGPVLHFHAPRLVALRGGDRNEETPASENEKGMLMHRACARALCPFSFLLLKHRRKWLLVQKVEDKP